MSTETQEVVAADGARFELEVYATEQDPSAPVMICMPAMGIRASFYRKLAAALVDQRLNVVLADLRGTGSSSIRPSRRHDFGYHEMIDLDWPATVQTVRQRFANNQLVLLGHSLGGQLSCLHQAEVQADGRSDEQVSGIILIAAPLVHFRGWPFPRNVAFLCATQLAAAVAHVVGHFPGERFHFGGRQPRTIIRDWARAVRSGCYRPASSSRDYESLLAKLKLPILCIALGADGFAPLAAVRALCDKMPRANVEDLQLDRGELGGEPLDHFNWVAESAMVARVVKRWAVAQIAR